MSSIKEYDNLLDYDDVFIVPQYSDIMSRKDVDTSVYIGGLKINVPVIMSPMDTISCAKSCIALWEAGAIGSLHRFCSIEQNLEEFNEVELAQAECFVSVGANEESRERIQELYKLGARYFIIDVAHGHHLNVKNMIAWMRKSFGKNVFIMAGSVTTLAAMNDLTMSGADLARVSVGPGSQCLTARVTGATMPVFSAIQICDSQRINNIPIVGDGGAKHIGDICKGIAAGANLYMTGFFFAGCEECPGEVITNSNGTFKQYRGMASKEAMTQIRKEGQLPTPEGKSSLVPIKGSVKTVIEEIAGGLRSSMSYSGARTIFEFQRKTIFGTRKQYK